MAEHSRTNSDSKATTEATPPSTATTQNNYGSLLLHTHPSQMTTYSAGEDSGRLATLAREFGLSHSQARPPRPQIRSRYAPEFTLDKLNLSRLTKELYGRMKSFDEGFEDLRLNAFMGTPHEDGHYEDRSFMEGEEELLLRTTSREQSSSKGLLLTRLPSLDEDEASDIIMTEEAIIIDPHAASEITTEAAANDPHAAGLGGSLSSATLGIIKGMVGPAILYLPHGFAMAGYLVAIPMLLLSTSLFLWSSLCLLDCWKMEHSKQQRKRQSFALSYPELAYRAWGIQGQRLVQIGISLMQSGVCLTYLIFVPQNLRTSALLLTGVDISTSLWLLLMVAVQIPLSWIRDIRRLTVTNLLANLLILFGLISCLGLAIRQMGEGESNEEEEETFMEKAVYRAESLPAFNPDGWFLFLGTSVLLFEGSITLLVPLIEAVHTQEDKKKFPRMYRKVILGIVSFYAFFGIVCWMAIGDSVRTVMTTSLPNGALATLIQLAYSLAVVFTFPLQNFPSLEIVCNSVEKMMPNYYQNGQGSDSAGSKGSGRPDKVKRNSSRSSEISNERRNIISSMVVVSLSMIAMSAMNDLDKVVSLMGGLLGCPLAFVLPPLIENELAKDGRIGTKKRVVNLLVATLGVGAMFVSTLTTLMNWE